jgi:uncharacterized protein
MRIRVTNLDRGGAVLMERGREARHFFSRGIGLLLDSHLAPGDGLMIWSGWCIPSNQIHSLMMRFPFDAAFLDRDLRVVQAEAEIKPWRLLGAVKGAAHTLELPAGTLARTGTCAGDRLAVAPAE